MKPQQTIKKSQQPGIRKKQHGSENTTMDTVNS